MSEDSIFMVNVEQNLMQKRLSKTCLYFLVSVYLSFGDEKKKTKFTANATLMYTTARTLTCIVQP